MKFCFSQEPVHRPGCTGSRFRSPFGLEDLSRESQLLFVGKCFIEFLHVHVVAPRRLVDAGDPVQKAGNQLFAEEEGVVRALWQVVIADAEAPGIGKAAVAVETDIALEGTAPKPMAAAFSSE